MNVPPLSLALPGSTGLPISPAADGDGRDGGGPERQARKCGRRELTGLWLVTARPTVAVALMGIVVLPMRTQVAPVVELYAVKTLPCRTRRSQTGAASRAPPACAVLRLALERH